MRYNIKYSLSKEALEKVKNLIKEYDGGEIFFGCILNKDGEIIDVDPICYGTDEAVLAPYEIVKRYTGIMHNHPSGNTKPSYEDLSYASFLQQKGIGFFIVDNNGERLTTIVPPIVKDNKIDYNDIEDIFSENGLISQIKEDYEKRDGQIRMAKLVAKSLNENRIAVIEAGTGIGKSLAYLIPSFLYAEKNDERIVISTHTINLQSQLVNKDIPLVKKILNSNIEPVLIKGRRNYLCKLKVFNIQSELQFESNEELLNILEWSKITKTGCIDELPFVPENEIWEKVSSDKDFCIGGQCAFYGSCFLQLSRLKAEQSNILIVNHHILFADIELKSNEGIFLPDYKKIIIDEAHNIEKSASSFFSLHFSKSGFYKFLSFYKSKNNKGLLSNIVQKFSKDTTSSISQLASFITDNVLYAFNTLYSESFNIFEKINTYIQSILENSNYYGENIRNFLYRIKEKEWQNDFFQDNFIIPLNELINLVEKFLKSYNQLIKLVDEIIEDFDLETRKKYEIDFKILKGYNNKLQSYYENIVSLLNVNPEEFVIWLDIFGNRENPLFTFYVSPIKIDLLLKEKMFDLYDSIIMTSATISVEKKFDYFYNMTGLSIVTEREIISDSIESPFDYEKQVLFVCPDDIPEPDRPEYNNKLNEFLKKTILATGGSTFVLFTSYEQLKKSYEEVNPYLAKHGYRSYYQNEMNNQKILDLFKENISSNLFATDSFWEGVDAPGKTLRYVVLAKLPFRMPKDPLEEAKVEYFEKKGLNPFTEWTLPQAVIRFKQGFGRLIRTKDDYGVVALLDSRALRKNYGRTFFKSIPRCKFFTGNTDQVTEEIIKHIKLIESTC
ncbi:MAG TPA: helicase C-terminal domain-containing protein [Spirochaetota bacterium]|nr:helicase C-terminal domain-containing protein [Spirochaetota bacterium]